MARASLADLLAAVARRLPGISEHPSQFGPMRAWWIDGREFAHLSRGTLSIRLTRRVIAERRGALRADPHVTLNRTDWVDVGLRRSGDLERATELFRLAAGANRRAPDEPRLATPDDRGLTRRRRLHAAATHDLEG